MSAREWGGGRDTSNRSFSKFNIFIIIAIRCALSAYGDWLNEWHTVSVCVYESEQNVFCVIVICVHFGLDVGSCLELFFYHDELRVQQIKFRASLRPALGEMHKYKTRTASGVSNRN